MSRHTPTVSAGALYDPAAPGRIDLDSPAWQAWLEAPTTTRFAYPLFDPAVGVIAGFMTVRKERRQRGSSYWVAYRRAGARLGKAYLGRAEAVTRARLEAIARGWLAAAESKKPRTTTTRKEDRSTSPTTTTGPAAAGDRHI